MNREDHNLPMVINGEIVEDESREPVRVDPPAPAAGSWWEAAQRSRNRAVIPPWLRSRSEIASRESHPPSVYLREDPVKAGVNNWLGRLFDAENVDATVAALAGSGTGLPAASARADALKKRLAEAEARVRRHQDAIAAGVDPAALVEIINQAQADRAAAQAELAHLPLDKTVDPAEVYAMIDSLGDVGAALAEGKTDSLAKLYDALNVQVRYEPETRVAAVSIQPGRRVNSERVRRGT